MRPAVEPAAGDDNPRVLAALQALNELATNMKDMRVREVREDVDYFTGHVILASIASVLLGVAAFGIGEFWPYLFSFATAYLLAAYCHLQQSREKLQQLLKQG